MDKNRVAILALAALALAFAGCGKTETTQATQLSGEEQAAIQATPPATISTPVPIVHAKSVTGSGRQDPFIVLYAENGGPPPSSSSTPRPVSVSTFPNIPTLPGFEGAVKPPRPASIWDTVKLTGIVSSGGYSAIVEANGRSYIVRPGDLVADTFRVVAIGPDSVTLATSKEQRRITLGG